MIFLMSHVMRDLMFHVLPFAVLNAVTDCKYNAHNLHRVFLHRKMPKFCIPKCLGYEIEVNFTFVNIEVRFGGCFNAKIALVSKNVFVSLWVQLDQRSRVMKKIYRYHINFSIKTASKSHFNISKSKIHVYFITLLQTTLILYVLKLLSKNHTLQQNLKWKRNGYQCKKNRSIF